MLMKLLQLKWSVRNIIGNYLFMEQVDYKLVTVAMHCRRYAPTQVMAVEHGTSYIGVADATTRTENDYQCLGVLSGI